MRTKEPRNKSSAERVAIKIGMITRRATKVVACAFMCVATPRSATKWHYRASPEGPGKRDRAASSATTAVQLVPWVTASRFEVPSSFGRHWSPLRSRTIRVVAFRASHPAKPSSRLRGFVHGSQAIELSALLTSRRDTIRRNMRYYRLFKEERAFSAILHT